MLQKINYYPIALIAIIGGAVYFLSGNLYNPGSIDYSEYQKVCEKYLADKTGEVSQDAVKSFVYKVDYLLPDPVNEISDPLQKSVKACSQQLKEHMANRVVTK